MKTPAIILTCLSLYHLAYAEPDALTNSQAYLAASLAAVSTPKMKEAPIKVDASISKATGVQEDSGAKAIVAIPDEGVSALTLASLPASDVPLCRLWLKSYALKIKPDAKAKVESKEVDAEGETHSVNIWLLGIRKSTKGQPELIVCANQKDPIMVLPLTALASPLTANADEPVQISVTTESERSSLTLTMLGTHEVKLELE